jgi:D-alanyl-D-alanine dipeptidase
MLDTVDVRDWSVRGHAPGVSSLRVVRRTAPLLVLVAVAAAPPSASAAGAEREAAFPARSDVRAVYRYLGKRYGLNSFALIDSRGHLHSFQGRRVLASASVVKAMLLVAYLRRIRRLPSREERRLLGPMVSLSDNSSATEIYRRTGDVVLRGLARVAGMRDFSVLGSWTAARSSAIDQARFFRRLDRLLPQRSRAYARRLLSSVVPWQRWGFTGPALRAGFTTYFKGGWRRTERGRLVHEAALLERGRTRIAMAVLTDGDFSHRYGTATLRGVAAQIFAGPARPAAHVEAGSPAHRRAGLADVRRYAPGLRLALRYSGRRNVMGRRLPGYCRPWALLLRPAARDLARIERGLNRRGLGLKVWDAYRPARASRALVDWANRVGRPELVGTYIARRSQHNLGSAVDLTLARLRSGRELPMGTGYDSFSRRAHTRAVSGRILSNRLTLLRAMAPHGFTNYRREWWHYEHRLQGGRHLDLSLGCNPR